MSETKKNNKKVTSNIILVNTDALDKSMLYVFTIALHILLSSSQILDVDGYGAKPTNRQYSWLYCGVCRARIDPPNQK